MATIFESVIANELRLTLDGFIDDDRDGIMERLDFDKWCEVKTMKNAWVDIQAMSGPGFASEVPEGTAIPMGSLQEGLTTRFLPRKVGIKLGITEEAMEDCKYPEILELGSRQKAAVARTIDFDATNMLNRAFNTSYATVDGQPMCSASHPLEQGGTESNLAAVPMSPSSMAVNTARAAVRVMKGHHGVREGYDLETVLCPVEQEGAWQTLTMSKLSPEAGNFAAINIVKDVIGLKMKTLKFLTASSVDYFYLTSCEEERPRFYWRKKPSSRSWVENSNEVMLFSTSCRFSRGIAGFRGIYGNHF